MKVVEIFKSIDGEGIRAGFPATFIRLVGCNLRCSYCDTRYSYENPEYEELTVDQIVKCVSDLHCHRITLTGGEPLIHDDVDKLITVLTDNGYEVNIETNGSVDIYPYIYNPNIILTVDYKCPSSGMESKMLLNNIKYLRFTDVLKFVVGTQEDLDKCRFISQRTCANVYVSPVFGQIQPKDIVDYILTNELNNCRVQLQLHKYIWDPQERGV
jgi:7-carboxy-7-deazaguanine synthase